MGFPVPFASWVRAGWNDVARDVLLDRRTRQRGILEPAAVDQLLRDHAAGRTEGGDHIWTLMNLELWYRTFVDRDGIQTLPEPAALAAHADSLAEVRPAAAAR
jgi:asparagine synthase (glutamine-hydrolysing)